MISLCSCGQELVPNPNPNPNHNPKPNPNPKPNWVFT